MGDVVSFPSHQKERLRASLRTLEAALAEQQAAIQEFRASIGLLRTTIGDLGDSFGTYRSRLGEVTQDLEAAKRVVGQLGQTARSALA